MYVTEAGNHLVQILKPGFTFLGVIGAKDKDGKPTESKGDGEFNIPMDGAFDNNGLAYVTDIINNQIQVFLEGGRFITKFGVSGYGIGELRFPCTVYVDKNINLLYVTEGQNFCVSVFEIVTIIFLPKF